MSPGEWIRQAKWIKIDKFHLKTLKINLMFVFVIRLIFSS